MNKYKKMFRMMVDDIKGDIHWSNICKQCGKEHDVSNCEEKYCVEQTEKYYKKRVKE